MPEADNFAGGDPRDMKSQYKVLGLCDSQSIETGRIQNKPTCSYRGEHGYKLYILYCGPDG